MELKSFTQKHTSLWAYGLPAALLIAVDNLLSETLFHHLITITILTLTIALITFCIVTIRLSPGGPAWQKGRNQMGQVPIPGPRGLPIIGNLFTLSHGGLAHRTLASMAWNNNWTQLMSLSLGRTPLVVSSDPQIAKEILTSPSFADRPIKQSAKQLMFSRAIGFAPSGTYWRMLRRVASSHLFSPRRILAYESGRQLGCSAMVGSIFGSQVIEGSVLLRNHLQAASLNNMMDIVFGKRYDLNGNGGGKDNEAVELYELVKEGFELLGAFNWCDHLPWLQHVYDPARISERCSALVPRVRRLVKWIINERVSMVSGSDAAPSTEKSCFVDVLLSLDGDEKLGEDDVIAVLWEMIFRGTDTTALLTEWIMAELILHPSVQTKLQAEIDAIVSNNNITEADIPKLHYLQAVVKETLRLHPPGPLLSWARLATSDQPLSNGMVVPSGTTAMVNMWAITHNPEIWESPFTFMPERFMGGAVNVDVRGFDLRLAPFGAGRRVCPGQNLAIATVSLWVAKLVNGFKWTSCEDDGGVDLGEVLKLSCEMKKPLRAVAIPRI